MNEERFAYHLRQRLNRSLDDISPNASRRLEAARRSALSHQKQEARVLAVAGAHGFGHFGHFDDHRLRNLAAVLLLLLGLAFVFYWQGQRYVEEIEDIDSALLSDAIPPDAFIDKGFAAWLDSSSE